MHRRHYRVGFKTNEQQRPEHEESSKIGTAGCDGETGVYEYSHAIFDLLKDPVSLGMQDANSNRGRQR